MLNVKNILDFISFIGYVILSLLGNLVTRINHPVFFHTPKPKTPEEASKKVKIHSEIKVVKSKIIGNKLQLLLNFLKNVIRKILGFLKIFRLRPTTRAFIIGALFSLFFVFIPIIVISWFKELPSPDTLVVEANRKSTRILDRNGKLLYEIYLDRNYNPVKIEDVPDFVISSTIAVEDDKFYEHFGIRLDSIMRAAKKTLFEGSLQGGSTITQQLIKNVLLTPERTISRKIKEAVLAVLIEAKYSKGEILEMYLNNIPYGGTSWGIQSASKKYFGKNVWELSLAEASLLAGLPTAPTSYSPISDFNTAKDRQRYVLDRMFKLGFITEKEFEEAYAQELTFIEQEGYIRAPHFVSYVRKDLENRFGKRYVELGGLTITTTLDLDLQDKVQSIVADEVNRNSYLGFSNGAAVVMSIKNSEVLAYVGSIDYFKEGWGAYDVVTALRQPGSSIKPVTYALALSGRYTPATIINDSPIIYKFSGSESYSPVNYDGRFHGKVTLRQALANSYNVPAVKVAYDIGVDNIVLKGREMGLTNWSTNDSYGLSVTLGGKEVRLLDHTNVFGTLARKGLYIEPAVYLSIKDSRGEEIYTDTRQGNQVISSDVAYLIWHILSDNNARTPAFGSFNSLAIPGYKVAVKTGTTDNIKDNWTMGYTPSYVVGVWVGNNNGKPMNRGLASGLTGAAPIWNKIMTEILKDQPNEIYRPPDNVFEKYDEKCRASEVFIKGTNIPSALCVDKEKDKDENKEGD